MDGRKDGHWVRGRWRKGGYLNNRKAKGVLPRGLAVRRR